ncbi:MAG: S1 RNA-binding domain-containing protein [Oscillospiraceae bacterium]|nr:S1 RNA-binding domain-containing protein [Oscillospiraceae bacterium]
MDLAVGDIKEGRVTGITKFGAFVALEGGRSGLVHISEIANTFVNDVHDHVQMGQQVKVKVLNISPEGKINLSIKRAAEPAEQPQQRQENRAPRQYAPRETRTQQPVPAAAQTSGNQDFEDRLKKFMQESDSRIADNRMYADHKQRRRGR